MQRNSSYIQILEAICFFSLLVLYQLLSSVFSTLPPFIGLFFTYVVIKHYEKDITYGDYSAGWYLGIAYLFVAERVNGFELFSIAISFGIYYFFLFNALLEKVKFRDLVIIISTVYGYIATFLVSNFLSYLKDATYLVFGFEYIMYIFVEVALSLLLFKGRII